MSDCRNLCKAVGWGWWMGQTSSSNKAGVRAPRPALLLFKAKQLHFCCLNLTSVSQHKHVLCANYHMEAHSVNDARGPCTVCWYKTL